MRKGFTLVELIIVVIVVGILATIAIPQYLRATERAKGAKARNALGLMSGAEKQCRAETDTYTTNIATLDTYVEMASITADTDWAYTIPVANTATFTIQARRSGGSLAGRIITLDDRGVWTGVPYP